jgi:hypothetical protein
MTDRVIVTGSGLLATAIERSLRIRCLDGPSRHRDRLRHVDICDEAFVSQPFCPGGSSRHRDRLLHVDIRDEASVPQPCFVSMAYRATATRLQHVDIRDSASVLQPLPRWLIAPSGPGFDVLTSAMKRSRRLRRLDGLSRHLD